MAKHMTGSSIVNRAKSVKRQDLFCFCALFFKFDILFMYFKNSSF